MHTDLDDGGADEMRGPQQCVGTGDVTRERHVVLLRGNRRACKDDARACMRRGERERDLRARQHQRLRSVANARRADTGRGAGCTGSGKRAADADKHAGDTVHATSE